MPANETEEQGVPEPVFEEAESTATDVPLATVSDKAMELLAIREHSRAELKEKLIRREYPSNFIESVLDDFAARNLQSDERFAEVYVRSRIGRGYGEVKIRAELQARGISGSMVALAMEASDTDWHANAEVLLQKKFLNRIDSEQVRSQKVRGKMQRFLQNRGYNSDQIISAVNRMADVVDASAEAGSLCENE